MRALAVAGCLAALASVSHADDGPQNAKARRAVLAAITARDPAALGAQLHRSLRLYHLWFDTAVCNQEFGGTVTVAKAKWPRLLGCLARLALVDRDDVFVHEPGVAITPLLYRGKLTGFSGVSVEAEVPTVTETALAKNLTAGTLAVEPDAATRASEKPVTVWLEACVDPKGAITAISTKRSTAPSYAKVIEAAAARWAFRPFLRGGKAIRVCLRRRYAFPAD